MKKRVRRHLPNFITCANLFSGCIGIVLASENLVFASYAIFLAAIFDFFDGLASRVLRSYSGIGKDLDSLADLVSFGVLPAIILHQLYISIPHTQGLESYMGYLVFLIPVFSALRLAKFNTDERQCDSFIGLPTPANAILIASFPFIAQQWPAFLNYILNPYGLAIFVLVMCALLVAELPLMSLKFKNRNFNTNIYRYLLLLLSAILILFFKFAAVPVVILFYITLSLIQFKFANDKVSS